MDEETKASPESARRAWTAALLMQRPALRKRFHEHYAQLMAMPRHARRRWRRATVTLAGAALLLGLSASPLLTPRVHAASITAGGTCSLVDAIRSANADTSYGTCAAGSGADTITLTGDVTLTASYDHYYGSGTGLPRIDSEIIIDGDGFTIERDGAAADFRLMAVSNTGDLTLRDVTLSGGRSQISGGAIFGNGPVTITNSEISGNYADGSGGGITQGGGALTITTSLIVGNTASNDGGGIYSGGTLSMVDSTVSGNTAESGGGIYSQNTVEVRGSTISDNTADADGGGIYNNLGALTVINSTISGNEATNDNGGGIYTDFGQTTLINTTVTGNTSGNAGGGTFNWSSSSSTTFIRSVVSGNSATSSGNEIAVLSYGSAVGDAYNVFGHDGLSNAAAFSNFSPGASDVTATSDGSNPTALAAILNTTLANNGGPTETHDLVGGSPAIDLAPGVHCTAEPTHGLDQRGAPRPFGAGCDAGAVEYGSAVPDNAVFVSTSTAGVTDDAVAFGPHDILLWDGANWSKWFDGTAAELTPNGKAKHNINAIWIPDPYEDTVYMSFAQNARFVPGVPGKVDGMDIVRWDSSDGFALAFDGQDVGLTNKSEEKIDAFHALDGSLSPVGGSCIAYLLISTQGPGQVPGVGGPIKFSGEDVLGFCLINDGAATTGVWHKLVDGSDEGMPRNSTASLSASEDGMTLYLTTKGAFNVDAASGGHSMVYEFDLLTGTFSGPVFVAADEGLHAFVDALNY